MDVNRKAVVVARHKQLIPIVGDALRAGIRISAQVHAAQHWNPEVDPQLASALIRREAIDQLKAFGAGLEDHDNLGLAFSGLMLRTRCGDVIRIRRSHDGELPPADSDTYKKFYRQESSGQGVLFDFGQDAETEGQGTNLMMLWDANEIDLTRFEMVRPAGVRGRQGLVDWRTNLLGRQQRVVDLDITIEGADEESGEQE